MSRISRRTLIALPLALLLAAPGWCSHGKKHARNGDPARGPRLELEKWPVFPGATVFRQVNLTGDQIAKIAKGSEGKELAKLGEVQILGLRLPPDATPERVVAFYEPRVLSAGFRVMIKNLEKPDDSAAVYTGPGGLLVLAFEAEKDGPNIVEIVSIRGGMADLAALAHLGNLGDLGAKLGGEPGEAPKPAK